MTTEHKRINIIDNKEDPSVQWGPYLSERQWGTVREDYSQDGNAWQYFPFEHSHYRAYQWGEDGLAGISDASQNLCFALAMWNGKDPILKERLFGLSNGEGNHGEDVKELYYYLDNLPSHYYMDWLYKYPQREFPYEELKQENRLRSKNEPEYELLDTGIFDQNQYFDVQVTYAKVADEDIFIRINIKNHYSEAADITLLPTLWFAKHRPGNGFREEPVISYQNRQSVKAVHPQTGEYHFYFQSPDDRWFTNNETNLLKVTGQPNNNIYVKDAFHDAVIRGENVKALRKKRSGSKFAPVYRLSVPAGATHSVYCRLSKNSLEHPFKVGFRNIFTERKKEADAYYNAILPKNLPNDMALIQRQALAGLLWSKQYYYFDVANWLDYSDGFTNVHHGRTTGRNHQWRHMKNQDIISMPDKWEYPWYAAWDLAFQCIALAAVHPGLAKHQLLLIMRESYMKPDGQLPAYEWNFSDVNPPVHAWAALEVYHIEKKLKGKGDIAFLEKIFEKLAINFTWWMNQKDPRGNHIFEGGFLGLDNIGVFNRSYPGTNVQLDQADATGWMGTFALNMMDIALEISAHNPSFEDAATGFFEHFVKITTSINEHHLWSEHDKFFYDVLSVPGTEPQPLQVKSIVGLTSLFAVSMVNRKAIKNLRNFKTRALEFRNQRKGNHQYWPIGFQDGGDEILLSLVPPARLVSLLERMLDEEEFLSPGGIRALSKYHQDHPYTVRIEDVEYTISYDPGDSTSDMFGGNSNWRGPVWIPINYLFIQSVRRYGAFYGDDLMVEFPTGSGTKMNLGEVADRLTQRVMGLFGKDMDGKRPLHGKYNWFYQRKENEHLVQYYEYFHGDTGQGLGASHQTGWTALVASLITEHSQYRQEERPVLSESHAV